MYCEIELTAEGWRPSFSEWKQPTASAYTVLHKRRISVPAGRFKTEGDHGCCNDRQKGKISKALREQAEEGMERMGRILGRTARASLTFSTERHFHIVELTVQARLQQFAATGKADTPLAALREAIEHAEHQASRFRDRRLVSKRLPKGDKLLTAPPVTRSKARVEPDAEITNRLASQARPAPPSQSTPFPSMPRSSSRTSSIARRPSRWGP